MRLDFSAGGVVYRKESNQTFILVCQHSQHHGWVFPKGLIGHQSQITNHQSRTTRETKEEAALREVREETGVSGKIIKELEPISYWYNFEGNKIKKTVYYFLMEYVSGNTKDHDFEMENVEWLPMEEVEDRLTYKSDKEVWQEAKKLIDK